VKKAFTLVELVVVLAIIAALTHLAVKAAWRFRDKELAKAADRQLEDIRDSIYKRSADGRSEGFLADMGRLPRLDGGTLSELWKMPTNALAYAVRRAVAPNLCPNTPEAPNVFVPTGWRGAYLRLPAGKSRLYDPWGNPVEAADDAGFVRVAESNGFAVAVSHFGPGAKASDGTRIGLEPDGGASSRLVVMADADAEVAWFGPCDGFVTGAVSHVSASAPAVFDGLTPGERVLVVSGKARTLDVRPGDNLVSLELQ
jgi:prepilin-type N-terminal cleavage/methylation domain-containing protein